jgi:imidazolonepropionase-like amidohydrolase
MRKFHVRRSIVLACLPFLFAAGVFPLHAFPAGPVALVDCVLIDGTGAAPVPDAVVLLSAGRIEAAGPRERIAVPKGYASMSLNGGRLLPGFINAHVHGAYSAPQLRRWLAAGVTSVRDCGPLVRDPDFVTLRDALNGTGMGARLISATPLMARPGGYGYSCLRDPASAREAARSFISMGVDLVKIAIEDDLQGRRWDMLRPAEIEAIVKEAHASGKRVSAHISHVRNLPLAIDGEVDDLAHMVVEPLSEADARLIAGKGIAWVPTLELWKGVSEKHGLTWDRTAIRNTGTFFRVGGRIALGTDFSGYSIPFDDGFPVTEARLLVEAGLSPMDVIVAGTRNAAEVSGRLADLGTVEKGKIADLLVVAGDPLHDISVLAAAVQVFKDGRPVTGE